MKLTQIGWFVYTTAIDGTLDYLSFTNGAKINSTAALPTSTVFTIDYSHNEEMIAYCFHDVEGYQKIGTYSGTGVASGNIIETGFEIAFLIIKRTDATANWRMLDNKRSTTNPRDKELFPNLANSESTFDAVNFLSNGFELATTDANYNNSSGTYLYLAIAADPDTTAPVVANSFDIKLYQGNGDSNTISGMRLNPELLWIKNRDDNTRDHQLWDIVRGDRNLIESSDTVSL